MARVNIEDYAFGDPGLAKLAMGLVRMELDRLSLAHSAALGLLAYLWHESQAHRVVDATVQEIERWTGIEGIVPNLVAAGFLTRLENGLFRINGNQDQIAGLEKKSIAGRAGAVKRWQKIASAIECQASDSTCLASDSRCLASDGTHMAKNGQLQLQLQERSKIDPYIKKDPVFKRVSKKTSAPADAGASPKEIDDHINTPGTRVWKSYVDAMKKHWNTTPPRNAKTAAQAKRLAELLGVELAIQLAAYYPTRRSEYYVRSGHPFGCLLQERDYASLLREMNVGLKLTKETVREITRKEESEEFEKKTVIGIVNPDPFALTEAELLEESRRLEPAR